MTSRPSEHSSAQSRIIPRGAKLLSYGMLAGLAALLLLLGAAALPPVFGYHTYTVEGGSMEPALERGSVAIAASASPGMLKVGDIVAYRRSPGNSPVLHRIVQITNDNGQLALITQGDDNTAPDPNPLVLKGSGEKVLYTIPYAGYVLGFARGTTGRVLLIGLAPILLGLFLTLSSLFGSTKRAKANVAGPAAPSTTARAQRSSLEAQAAERGMLAIAPIAGAGRPSLEAQAARLLSKQSRPSLAAQALQLQTPEGASYLTLVAPPARPNADREARAA